MNYLNIALASFGQFHSSYESILVADQISKTGYEQSDQLHYKVENDVAQFRFANGVGMLEYWNNKERGRVNNNRITLEEAIE